MLKITRLPLLARLLDSALKNCPSALINQLINAKWYKMAPNGSLTYLSSVGNILALFRPFWTLSHKNRFLPSWSKCFWAENQVLSELDRKGLNEPKMVPNDQKHVRLAVLDNLAAPLDHFGTLRSLSCLAISGPKRAILEPPVHIMGGLQLPKLHQTNLVNV